MGYVETTNSELGSVRTCERRWSFEYLRGLRPTEQAAALRVGTAVHEGVADAYRQVKSLQESGRRVVLPRLLEGAERACIGALREQSPAIDSVSESEALVALRHYVTSWVESDAERFDVVAVEQAFRVPVPNEQGNLRSRVWLRGRFDLVLKDRSTGAVVLGELKTARGAACDQDARQDTDQQFPAYAHAMGVLWPSDAPRRVLLSVVRKAAPSTPRLLKDGTVSAAAIDTTRALYRGACDKQAPAYLSDAAAAEAEARARYHAALASGDDTLRAQRAHERAAQKLLAARERFGELVRRQELREQSLPETLDRWAFRTCFTVDAAQVERWRADLHRTVKRQLRPLLSGAEPARNGRACGGPFGCPFVSLCVDDSPPLAESLRFRVVDRHHETVEGEVMHG